MSLEGALILEWDPWNGIEGVIRTAVAGAIFWKLTILSGVTSATAVAGRSVTSATADGSAAAVADDWPRPKLVAE